MTNTLRNDLKRSARTKLAAARHLMEGRSKHPSPAAYLSHVTLECALKVHILVKGGAERTEDLRNKRGFDEATFDGLFNGRTGHNLHHLAKEAGLKRLLVAKCQDHLLKIAAWHAMSGDRPYSLRYGSEVVSDSDADQQVDLATKLTSVILENA